MDSILANTLTRNLNSKTAIPACTLSSQGGSWQHGWGISSTPPTTMGFKNEVVSDEDIDRYNLPFPKGGGRWWTRDADRDYYLWGGLVGNLAFDPERHGLFYLCLNNIIYRIQLAPGRGSTSLNEVPYIVKWEKIIHVDPEINCSNELKTLELVLKEALVEYGYDGQDDGWIEEVVVTFGF